MHGRPRKPHGVTESPEKLIAKEKKLESFRQLTNLVLQKVAKEQYDQESLAQSALLLEKNPDVYTVWNYRRRAIAPALEGSLEEAKEAIALELRVTEAALRENPKSYSVWYHRLWIMRKGYTSLSDELKQVSRFLKLDGRNFHAWKYRREIVKLAGTDPNDELDYTRSLLEADFTNYSAWHARTCLLTELHSAESAISLQDLVAGKSAEKQPALIPADVLDQEYKLVEDACIAPEVQSAYCYHRWLLQCTMAHVKQAQGTEAETAANEYAKATLEREEKLCLELLEEDLEMDQRKWPTLSVAHILELQQQLGVDPSKKDEIQDRLKHLYGQLAELDPLRAGYYNDAAKRALLI